MFREGDWVRIKETAFEGSTDLNDIWLLGEVGWIEVDEDNKEPGCWIFCSARDDGLTWAYVMAAEIEHAPEEQPA